MISFFRCGCPDGFVMNNVYQECVDANECLETDKAKTCGSAKCQNSFGSFSCLCPNGYSYNGNMKVCVQSASGCGEAKCAFGCNNVGSTGFDCQCPRGHQVRPNLHFLHKKNSVKSTFRFQAVMGPRGQVSHCIALNSVDNFLQEDNEKDFISTEGCYSCKINGRRPPPSRTQRSRYSQNRRSQYRYRKRRTKRHTMLAKFSSLRPCKFFFSLQDLKFRIGLISRIFVSF